MSRYSYTLQEISNVPVYFLSDTKEDISIGIAPSKGSEICSYKYKNVELIHRALEFTVPTGNGEWYGHGQTLFPAVGRHANSKYTWSIDNNASTTDITIPLHGFAKDVNFSVQSCTTNENNAQLVVVLEGKGLSTENTDVSNSSSSSSSPVCYPFPYRLEITYRVTNGVVHCEHRITNTGNNNYSGLPFAIGNHITLKYPFTASGTWKSGRLLSTVTHEHCLTTGSLLSGELIVRPEFQSNQGCSLTAKGATDGVFGIDTQRSIDASIQNYPCSLMVVQPGSISVEISHQIHLLSSSTEPISSSIESNPTNNVALCDWNEVSAHRYFVLWGEGPKPLSSVTVVSSNGTDTVDSPSNQGSTVFSQGFICPEPWVSGPDSLNTRKGLPILAPNQTALWTFAIATTGELK